MKFRQKIVQKQCKICQKITKSEFWIIEEEKNANFVKKSQKHMNFVKKLKNLNL